MKNIFRFLIACTMCIGVLYSCKEMDFTYRQFIEDGETVYISKADSIITRGGNGRIEVSWLLLSDPKVASYKMYWNSRTDSVEGSLQKTENVDTVRVMLENMEEGVYEFEIILYDKFGNTSVTSSRIGRVYGERYQNNLYNRLYRNFRRANGGRDLAVNWVAADDQVVYSDIKYRTSSGDEKRYRLDPSEEASVLEDFPVDATFDMRTVFLPDRLSLDTFYTDFESVEPVFIDIEVDKSLWKNAMLSDDTYDEGYRKLSDLWDNTITQYFRNRNNATTPELPHWFTIDLGKKYILSKILVNQYVTDAATGGNWVFRSGSPRTFEIYGSDVASTDWDDWKLLGQFESIKPSGLPVNENTQADIDQARAGEVFEFIRMNDSFRYIRFKTTSTWGGNKDIMLAELTLWGQEADD